jgi:methyl-accepting chemotaxis protein
MITVWSYGLTPAHLYTFTDSVLAGDPNSAHGSIGLAYEDGYASLHVILGSFDTASGSILSAPNGTLAFSYAPFYATLPTPPATGVVSAIAGLAAIDTYHTIGTPTVGPSAFSVYAGGVSVTFTVANLIPENSLLYPGTPAVSYYYNLYLGTSLVGGQAGSTCLSSPATTCYATGTPAGTLTIKFTPPLTTGVEEFAITYLGGSSSSALAEIPVILSVPGATVGAGTLSVETNPVSGDLTAIGIGLLATASVYDLNISTSLGVVTVHPSVGATTGAFAYDMSSYTDEPAGTYGLYLYLSTASGSSATLTASYSVFATLTISSPASAEGPIGTSMSAVATGLAASAYYDVYLGSVYLETVSTSSSGSVTVSPSVPAVAPGSYALQLDPTGTTHAAVSAGFTVTGSPTISLATGAIDQSYAFPGELLTYSWEPGPRNTPTFAPYPFTVTVLLNGTPYATEPGLLSASTITGSFTMPNACSGSAISCAGTYWWVTLSWSQVDVRYTNATSYTEPSVDAAFLQLVQGNGAFLTGITPTQIAEIIAGVNQSLEVPLAELHAIVVSINDGVVNLTTDFGRMTTTLNAIDATVRTLNTNVTTGFGTVNLAIAEVSNGIVTLESSVGNVTTSLSALGARITSIEGSVASINSTIISVKTTLGVVNTTLTAIDATVTTTATSVNGLVGSVATIQTTLGTISGQITSVQNGVATIQTQIGELETNISNVKTSVSNAQSSVQTALYWEIAAVALLIVTLALTALLIGQARRPPRPPSPPSGWKSSPPPTGAPPPQQPPP